MELTLISFGIMVATELLKVIHKRFNGTCWDWWIPHVLVFGGALVAVIVMRVAPQEFITDFIQVFSQSVAFYELIWKRVVAPAIDQTKQ